MRAASIAHLRKGELFASRYRIERLLGEGGMGAVYEVVDEQLDDRVALKVMAFGAGQRDDIQRFVREVRLARRITHANVARTHDIGEHEGRHFLTMELIVGDTLDELIEQRAAAGDGRVSVSEAVELAIPIAEGLQAAHDAGVVHRDLKPANVMVEGAPQATGPLSLRRRRVVITDFGVARPFDADTARSTGIIGTPVYMSPEQVVGAALGPQSDLYSFGVMLYELLSGALPFEGTSPMAVAVARLTQPPGDLRTLVQAPPGLVDLVLACLERAPEARPSSAAALAASLRAFGRASSAETVMVPSVHPSQPPRGSNPSNPSGVSSPFAPLSPGKRVLAVLPFSYRGPADLDYLGASLAQELTDNLSRTRGLRVLGFGAASALGQTDPRAAGRELGAEVVVSGSVIASHERVRVSVRLTDVADGLQLWTGRFDKPFEDVFDMQHVVASRVAEGLRLELSELDHRWRVTAPALELYLRARKLLDAKQHGGAAEAVRLLKQSLELSPEFGPAMAALANAAVKAWWMDIIATHSREYATIAKDAVERALVHADNLAETHLAAGIYALQLGDLPRTANELATALGIAPTLVEAHRYLAELQCEAGRTKEGVRRARIVLELDPTQHTMRHALARYHALRGEHAEAAAQLDRLAEDLGDRHAPLVIMRVRFALWRGDVEKIREQIDALADSTTPLHLFLVGACRYTLGQQDDAIVQEALGFAGSFENARLTSLVGQLTTEVYAGRGDIDKAFGQLEKTALVALVDVDWLERCPLLAPLRKDARFRNIVTTVTSRAEAIWHLRNADTL